MVEVVEYIYDEPNSWLWAGYAFTLIAVLAYIFSDFLLLPMPLIITLFVLGAIMLIVGYSNRAKTERKTEAKKPFRHREF